MRMQPAINGRITLLHNSLLDLIKSGELVKSGRLPTERVLAVHMDVSRRHIRQALDTLEAEGVIWRQQGKGTFIGQPSDPMGDLAAKITGETNVLEVMEARLCIEPELASLCALRMLPDEVARLRNLALWQFEVKDAQATELWDASLHRLIAKSARNRPLLTAYSLLDKIRRNADWVAIRARARDLASIEVSQSQHVAIIDAIELGDAEAAKKAMRHHLEARFVALRAALKHQTPIGDLKNDK